MTVQFRTRTFKSGNSVAVRLPKGLDISEGVDVVVEQGPHGRIEISRVANPAEEKRRWLALLDKLKQMRPPIVAGARLVTIDGRDFANIPGLDLEVWPSPA